MKIALAPVFSSLLAIALVQGCASLPFSEASEREMAMGESCTINAAMVLAKQAWHYQRYSGTCPNGSAIATAAQMAGTPPWEWRRR